MKSECNNMHGERIKIMDDTWENEMWTPYSSNVHFIISYGWLLKCFKYQTATSSTYIINIVSNPKFVIPLQIHSTPLAARKTNY